MAVLWGLGPSAPAKAFTTLRVRVRINQKCIFFYIFGSSQGYEATNNFYLKKNDVFNPEDYNSFKTKEYPILTIGSFIGNRYSAAETWIEDGEIPEFSSWANGIDGDDADYKKYGFDKLLGMEKIKFLKKDKYLKSFHLQKLQ